MRLVTETTLVWHHHAHCMSRGGIILSTAVFDMLEILWIEIHKPGWLREQKYATAILSILYYLIKYQTCDVPNRTTTTENNGPATAKSAAPHGKLQEEHEIRSSNVNWDIKSYWYVGF